MSENNCLSRAGTQTIVQKAEPSTATSSPERANQCCVGESEAKGSSCALTAHVGIYQPKLRDKKVYVDWAVGSFVGLLDFAF